MPVNQVISVPDFITFNSRASLYLLSEWPEDTDPATWAVVGGPFTGTIVPKQGNGINSTFFDCEFKLSLSRPVAGIVCFAIAVDGVGVGINKLTGADGNITDQIQGQLTIGAKLMFLSKFQQPQG